MSNGSENKLIGNDNKWRWCSCLESQNTPKPIRRIKASFSNCVGSKRIVRSSKPIKMPTPASRIISMETKARRKALKCSPLTKTSARETETANTMMTTASVKTVIPSTLWVNGPLALSSLIIPNADEGDRATIIVEPSNATANNSPCDRVDIKGMCSFIKKKAAEPIPRIAIVCPPIDEMILLK